MSPVLHPPRQRIKPGKWAVDPGLAAPEWRWAWRGLPVWYPLWEGGGVMRDVAGGTVASPGDPAPAWVATSYGIATGYDSAENFEIEEPGGASYQRLNDSDTFTYVAVFTLDTFTTDGGGGLRFVTEQWGGSSGALTVSARTDQSDEKLEVFLGGSGYTEISTGAAIELGKTHVAIVRVGGGEADLWLDGSQRDSASQNAVGSTTAPFRVGEGTDSNTGEMRWSGDIGLIGILPDQRITDEQAQQLSRDPFGPFRPQRTVWVRVPATGGTTVSVGRAIETNEALGAGSAKADSVSEAVEADQAQSVTPERTHSVGLPTTTDSALAAVVAKTMGVGQGQETSEGRGVTSEEAHNIGLSEESGIAQSVTALRSILLGQTSEADTALGTTSQLLVKMGLASETDSGLNVSSSAPQNISVGQATETDSAFSVSQVKTLLASLAEETDAGLSVTPQTAQSVAIGLSTETDTGRPVSYERAVSVVLAEVADNALAASAARSLLVGLSEETDSALSVSVAFGLILGLAQETDTAEPIQVLEAFAVGLGNEIDAARGISPRQIYDIGQALESDEAQAVSRLKSLATGLTEESDTALQITVAEALAIGLASETDVALAVQLGGILDLPSNHLLGPDAVDRVLRGEMKTRTLEGDD